MACPISLFSYLSSLTTPGGNWFSDSAMENLLHSSAPNSTTIPAPNTYSATVSIAPGDPIGTTEYLWVDLTHVPKGRSYTFRYVVSSGAATSEARVTLVTRDNAISGTATPNLIWCKDDTEEKNLWNLLSDSPYDFGKWSGSGTLLPGYNSKGTNNPKDDTFRPSGNGLNGGDIINFTYTVNSDVQPDCPDCNSSTTVSVLIDDSCSPAYPCDCQYTEALYYLDIFNAGPGLNSTWLIQQVGYPEALLQPLAGNNYLALGPGNDSFVNTRQCKWTGGTPDLRRTSLHYDDPAVTINNLIPNFFVENQCAREWPVPRSFTGNSYAGKVIGKYYKVRFPSCYTWFIIFRFNGQNWIRWNQDGVSRWNITTLAWEDITLLSSPCSSQLGGADCQGWGDFGTIAGNPSYQGVLNRRQIKLC